MLQIAWSSLWGLNEIWPVKYLPQCLVIFRWWSVYLDHHLNITCDRCHTSGDAPCLGASLHSGCSSICMPQTNTQRAIRMRAFPLGCICKRVSCAPRAASCLWEYAATMPGPHARPLPKTSGFIIRSFPCLPEARVAQEHVTTSWGPRPRAPQPGMH